MSSEDSGYRLEGLLCPDSITARAPGVLESQHPTEFTMCPTEDPKINIIFELGGEDFSADFDLLGEISADFRFWKETDQIAWAENVLTHARTETLKAFSPYDLARAFRR